MKSKECSERTSKIITIVRKREREETESNHDIFRSCLACRTRSFHITVRSCSRFVFYPSFLYTVILVLRIFHGSCAPYLSWLGGQNNQRKKYSPKAVFSELPLRFRSSIQHSSPSKGAGCNGVARLLLCWQQRIYSPARSAIAVANRRLGKSVPVRLSLCM